MRVGLTYRLNDNRVACAGETNAIASAIEKAGHDVIRIGAAHELVDKLAAGERFDVVFNACRDCDNALSDANIPTLLNIYGVACCFSSPATLNLCSQRHLMKSLLRDRGVPTSDYWLVETLGDIQRVDVSYPAMVGPTTRCNADQLIKVNDATELSKACCQMMGNFGTPALIEQDIEGEHIEVALIGDGSSASVLLPANVPAAQISSLERTAKAAWRTIGGCDAGCISLLCDAHGQAHVVSIEPLPSLSQSDNLMCLASQAGLNAEEIVVRILKSAIQRRSLSPRHQPRQPHLLSTNLVGQRS